MTLGDRQPSGFPVSKMQSLDKHWPSLRPMHDMEGFLQGEAAETEAGPGSLSVPCVW